MTTQVDWNDGTGEKITLTYAAAQGAQTISVSSPANAGVSSRSKIINFTTSAGTPIVTRTLTIIQAAGSSDLIIITRNDVYPTYNDVAIGYANE